MKPEVFAFQYELASDGTCVPVAILNCIAAVACRLTISPQIVRAVFRHSLDDPQARKTSSEAIGRIVDEMNQHWSPDSSSTGSRFRVSVSHLIGAEVSLSETGRISEALSRGGSAMLLLNWPRSTKHAITLLKMNATYLWGFDSRLRLYYTPPAREGVTYLGKPGQTHGANLRILKSWAESEDDGKWGVLGSIPKREAVTFTPCKQEKNDGNTVRNDNAVTHSGTP